MKRLDQVNPQAVHQALSNFKPSVNMPPDLHEGVMQAVRSAANRRAAVPACADSAGWFRTWALPVGAALTVGAFLAVALGPQPVSPPAAVRQGKMASAVAAETAPTIFSVMGLLEQEMRSVSQDATNAARFLLSSLP